MFLSVYVPLVMMRTCMFLSNDKCIAESFVLPGECTFPALEPVQYNYIFPESVGHGKEIQ